MVIGGKTEGVFMATAAGNRKVAAIRGKEWREKLVRGKLDATLHPTHLKLKRVQKPLSQDFVATSVGLSLSTYGAIERGTRPVTKETAEKLSKLIGSPITTLFSQSSAGKLVATRVKNP